MGLLDGKTALIFGLANERSIAWGITQAMHREGAKIGISYAGEALKRRVQPLAEQIQCKWVEECDVTSDQQIAAIAEKAAKDFGKIDVLVHSIAFAGRDELSGPYYNTSREGFKNAMDISVYSFVALAKAFRPLIRPGGSLICMTYYGSVKVAPHYNVMGVAKAALEFEHAVPSIRPRAGEDPGERDLGWSDPDLGRGGRGGIPRYVQAVRRRGTAAREHHDRGCGQRRGLPGLRHVRRASPGK